jgi:hypothetical protein
MPIPNRIKKVNRNAVFIGTRLYVLLCGGQKEGFSTL